MAKGLEAQSNDGHSDSEKLKAQRGRALRSGRGGGTEKKFIKKRKGRVN